MRRKKLIVWGMGKEYNQHLNMLKCHERDGDIEVIGVTASFVPNYEYIDDWKIINSKDIIHQEFDYILIFSERYLKDIVLEIIQMGIERRKALAGRILDIPYFSWEEYTKIYESNLSIISNNCAGGIICRTLGLECLSPFKNLWVDPMQLCDNYKELPTILRETPIFDRWENDSHSQERCPVGRIHDMRIHFNHDNNWEDAVKKWNDRVTKVNYENLFLMIYAEDEKTVKSFIGLMDQGYKGVCFVPEELVGWSEQVNIYCLRLLEGQKEFYEIVNSSVSGGRNALSYNLLSMLNGEKKLRLK